MFDMHGTTIPSDNYLKQQKDNILHNEKLQQIQAHIYGLLNKDVYIPLDTLEELSKLQGTEYTVAVWRTAIGQACLNNLSSNIIDSMRKAVNYYENELKKQEIKNSQNKYQDFINYTDIGTQGTQLDSQQIPTAQTVQSSNFSSNFFMGYTRQELAEIVMEHEARRYKPKEVEIIEVMEVRGRKFKTCS